MNTLENLREEATVVIGRKRRTQTLLVASFVVGLAVGFVLGFVVN
jgi:tetrahydromethanopterin S-methyltransferase subunit F